MSQTPQVPVRLSVAEQGKLRGLPYFVRCLYILAIRPYMDMETGVVGLRSQISYGSLAADMHVEPHQGEQDSGTPTTSRTKRGVQRLIKAGLIENRSVSTPTYKRLVFFCPAADTGKFVRKKPGPNSDHSPEPQPGSLTEHEEPSDYAVSEGGYKEEPGPLPEPPENSKPGSHPESGKRLNTTTTTHSSYYEGGEAETCDSECGGGGGGEEEEKSRQEATPPPVQLNMPLFCPVPTALIYPKALSKAERRVAHRMVAESGDQAQALLDELAAVMKAGKIRVSPLSCLRGMVQRATAGTFVPEAGIPIAEARRQKAQTAARLKAAENRPPAVPEEPAPQSPEQTSHRRREAAAAGIGFAKAALRGCRSP